MKIHLIQLFLVGALLWQHPASSQSLSAEQAAADAAVLVNTMRALHPALDKYRSMAEVNASFERFRQRAEAARSASQMYLAVTELGAAVRCGHTWTNTLNQQGAIKNQLLESADKLPFTMTLIEGRWLVLASANPDIAAGDEVLAIDGRATAQVVAMMLPYLRADGASDGKRLRQLSHDRDDYSMMDLVWPLLAPPPGGIYRISVQRGAAAARTVQARALTLAERSASIHPKSTPDQRWRMRIDGARAVMTLPSFSVYRSKFDWKQFFADSFAELGRAHVKHLVIDIRHNEGGDDAIGLALLSYLVNAPLTHVSDQSVTTYERVPDEIKRHLQTWDSRFFERIGMVDRITNGPQAGRLSFRPNARKAFVIAPQPNRFAGKVWLLVGPENSSATFLLARLVKASGTATLIGQATGGNERGLNGGQLAWVTLPASGVALDIPLLATSYSATTPDASVTPDIVVTPSFYLRTAGRDQEMEALDKLLQRP